MSSTQLLRLNTPNWQSISSRELGIQNSPDCRPAVPQPDDRSGRTNQTAQTGPASFGKPRQGGPNRMARASAPHPRHASVPGNLRLAPLLLRNSHDIQDTKRIVIAAGQIEPALGLLRNHRLRGHCVLHPGRSLNNLPRSSQIVIVDRLTQK